MQVELVTSDVADPRSGWVGGPVPDESAIRGIHGATFATAAYVRDQMGHSSIKVTFDTYGHLFPSRGKEASARYEKSMAAARVRQKARGPS